MITKEYLEKEYIENDRTTREIASDFNVSKTSIQYWLKKYNIQRRSGGQKFKSLIGKRFNNLVVIEKVGLKRHAGWLCKCDCGNIVKVDASSLRNGRKYCWDCRNKAISERNWTGHGEISGDFWDAIKKSARARNMVFDITIEYAWELFLKQNRKCALSNIEITFKRGDKDLTEKTASLDRIDSSKGYIKGNLQWVHKTVNVMKQALDEDIFIDFCEKIVNYKKRKVESVS